jgi:hypothetical protein
LYIFILYNNSLDAQLSLQVADIKSLTQTSNLNVITKTESVSSMDTANSANTLPESSFDKTVQSLEFNSPQYNKDGEYPKEMVFAKVDKFEKEGKESDFITLKEDMSGNACMDMSGSKENPGELGPTLSEHLRTLSSGSRLGFN